MSAGKGPELGAGVWGRVSATQLRGGCEQGRGSHRPTCMAPVGGLEGDGRGSPSLALQQEAAVCGTDPGAWAPTPRWCLFPLLCGCCSLVNLVAGNSQGREELMVTRPALPAGHRARGRTGRAMGTLLLGAWAHWAPGLGSAQHRWPPSGPQALRLPRWKGAGWGLAWTMGTVSGWALREAQRPGCLLVSAKAPPVPAPQHLASAHWVEGGGIPQGHTTNWWQVRLEWV